MAYPAKPIKLEMRCVLPGFSEAIKKGRKGCGEFEMLQKYKKNYKKKKKFRVLF